MMKIALIGQDIPTLLPGLLADLLFAGRTTGADVALMEKNPAMHEVLENYGRAVLKKSGLNGSFTVTEDLRETLTGADCVIFAGDLMAASRFEQDRQALSGEKDDDPGLSDQARVNGGIGGLLHTLRAGENVLQLCEDMKDTCPEALVICLGQPVARMTELFVSHGHRCYGLGRTPLRGANGLDSYAKRLHLKPTALQAEIAGLPGFAFLLSLRRADTGEDLLPRLRRSAENGELGRLCARWLDWYGAIAVGDVTDHAEFLPAQPDYKPEERPEFGESIEKRKDRILFMNTVGQKGADDREGAMAQLLLLSRVPPVRPMRLALALLEKTDLEMPAVTRKNGRALPQLDPSAVIEAPLTLKNGRDITSPIRLPDALADIMGDIDRNNRLAARAAAGDRSALRESVETDPALSGLDRLYCQDVVNAMIAMHDDIIVRLQDEEDL